METELVGFGLPGLAVTGRYIMETETRPGVELTDSLTVTGSVVLAHRCNHKLMSVGVLTSEELQEFVQQAHDKYGVTADPFATPGSADFPLQRVHNHGVDPSCRERMVGDRLRGACLEDDGTSADPWADSVRHGVPV